MLVDRR